MKHINHRVHKWQVRDMQRQALYGALRQQNSRRIMLRQKESG